jgi:site-specific recombinase XerD
LDEWSDIDDREQAAGIDRHTPILIDPCGRIDPRLARYFRRSRYRFFAESTQESYAKDYRLFFSFLWQRGKNWSDADHEDIDDYEAWRRRSEDNPGRIGGAKWGRELAAFKTLYEWAEGAGFVERSPVLTHTIDLGERGTAEVSDNRPTDVRCANVKWLTPRTYRWWRDVGLRGYRADGLPDPSWRGRNGLRNAAFADLLFDSGLRLREGGCLLTLEIPDSLIGQSLYEGTVAAGTAKRRARMFYVSADAVASVTTYLTTMRQAAVRRAQRAGRYDALPGRRTVTEMSGGAEMTLGWRDEAGREGSSRVNLLTPWERSLLFVEGRHGLEPLWLWLGESGLPLDHASWEKTFDAANLRCVQNGKKITVAPHMLRHSFALKMLITLQRAHNRRYGLADADRQRVGQIYGEVYKLVKDLLGHASEQTTRDVYCEPVTGLRLSLFLNGNEDLDAIMAKVASSSRRVMDVFPGQEDR